MHKRERATKGEPGGDGQEERARGAPTADRASRSVGARAEPEENKRTRNAAYRSLFAPGTPDRDRNRSPKATVFPDLSHTASPPMCHTQSFCPGCSGNGSNLSYTTLTTLAAPRADPCSTRIAEEPLKACSSDLLPPQTPDWRHGPHLDLATSDSPQPALSRSWNATDFLGER